MQLSKTELYEYPRGNSLCEEQFLCEGLSSILQFRWRKDFL